MSGYVDEQGRNWDDGFIQMLSDPRHFKITPCEVVDYSQAPAEAGPAGWEPLDAKPEPPPPSRWALLKAALISAQVEGAPHHVIFNTFVLQAPRPIPCFVEPGEHWEALIDAEMFRFGVEQAAGGLPPPWQARAVVKDAGERFYYGEWVTVPKSLTPPDHL